MTLTSPTTMTTTPIMPIMPIMSTMAGRCGTQLAFAALLAALPSPSAPADTAFLEFEELFGRCAPTEIVAGRGQFTVDGVEFTAAGPQAWCIGSEVGVPAALGNPFKTDALLLSAEGDGSLIRFPEPVVQVEFVTGLHVHGGAPTWFELLAHGRVVASFSSTSSGATHVLVALTPPALEVRIRWARGPLELLGLENLGHVAAVGCHGDLDGDGSVDGRDLGLLLAQWGGGGAGDLDGSGVVDGADLAALLGEWGEWEGCLIGPP